MLIGAEGFLGQAIARESAKRGIRLATLTRRTADLLEARRIKAILRRQKPSGILLAAGRNAGIGPNAASPWDFLCENLLIQTHVLQAALAAGVPRLVLFGSSAIYPGRGAAFQETDLGRALPPHELRGYGQAKATAVIQCWAANRQHGTRYGVLTIPNLYGPGMPLLREGGNAFSGMFFRIREANFQGKRGVPLMGHPETRREFLFVGDLAELAVDLATGRREAIFRHFQSDELPHLHAGTGRDTRLGALARLMARELGWKGTLVWQGGKRGAHRKLLDSRRIHRLGWRASTGLKEGIRQTAQWLEKSRGPN